MLDEFLLALRSGKLHLSATWHTHLQSHVLPLLPSFIVCHPWRVLGGGTVVVIISYLTLVRLTRWRRVQAMEREFAALNDPKVLGSEGKKKYGFCMSPQEAQKIVTVSTEYDMPELMDAAVAYSLYKTYAIPSTSRILLATKQLSTEANGERRYVDTLILLNTWLHNPIVEGENLTEEEKARVDSRAALAIARSNWIHQKYPIKMGDNIFTLSLFILEPIRWAERFGWRSLTLLEKEAFFVFWYDLGTKLGITDIPTSLQELEEWSEAYASEYMVPAQCNHEVGSWTLIQFLSGVPTIFGFRKFFKRIVIALFDERVRLAMKEPAQPAYIHMLATLLMRYLAFKQRYLSLPRSQPVLFCERRQDHKAEDGKPIRMHPNVRCREPWYIPEPSGVALFKQKIAVTLGFVDKNLVPGPKFKSEGYRLEELGPPAMEKAGHKEVMKMAAEIQGCPVVGPWALQ